MKYKTGIFLLTGIACWAFYAYTTPLSVAAETVDRQTTDKLGLIEKRINQFSQAYPEITFRLLHDIGDLEPLLPLAENMGDDLSNVDYEHPQDLRMTLVEVQEYRIALMLKNDMGSATLFRTPNQELNDTPYLCMITLNRPLLAQDSLAATQFMYPLDETTLASVPKELQLNDLHFLLFSLDHELFHCINIYQNGPAFMQTADPVKANHDRKVSELRSEIFASIAHLARHPDNRELITGIATARTLNLLGGDAEHYSASVLYSLYAMEITTAEDDIGKLTKIALQLADSHTPTYAEYREHLVATRAAIKGFGIDPDALSDDYALLADDIPVPEKVEMITKQIMDALSAVGMPR